MVFNRWQHQSVLWEVGRYSGKRSLFLLTNLLIDRRYQTLLDFLIKGTRLRIKREEPFLKEKKEGGILSLCFLFFERGSSFRSFPFSFD